MTCSIFTLSHCACTFCICLFVKLSYKWHVSGIDLVYTVFLFHFCSVILIFFIYFFSEIIFCRYVGGFYVSLHSYDYTACFGYSDSVPSAMEVICLMSYY